MRRKFLIPIPLFLFLLAIGGLALRHSVRYETSETTIVPIRELARDDYPEDPAHHSIHYNKYDGRLLRLVKRDQTHFDFDFISDHPHVASISIHDVDLSLILPVIPFWVRKKRDLEHLTLIEREWNRQQVLFTRDLPEIAVRGGDGFEKKHLHTIELARNCLNAGLFEFMLYTVEKGKKALLYHGWFTFPLGHYKEIFEVANKMSYWKHWYRLEHWFDPEGIPVDLSDLRTVMKQAPVQCKRVPLEKVVLAGEQAAKDHKLLSRVGHCQKELCTQDQFKFATFIPPGRYSIDTPWDYEYEELPSLIQASIQTVICPHQKNQLHEIEMQFTSSKNRGPVKLIIGGIDLTTLPRLPKAEYPKGLYMPMGIALPPVYQLYSELKQAPPQKSPYYAFLLDEKGGWINHHTAAIDGPVLHRDMENPNLLHLYLLSYERIRVVAHFEIPLDSL